MPGGYSLRRPTQDIDFCVYIENSAEDLVEIIKKPFQYQQLMMDCILKMIRSILKRLWWMLIIQDIESSLMHY